MYDSISDNLLEGSRVLDYYVDYTEVLMKWTKEQRRRVFADDLGIILCIFLAKVVSSTL